MNFMRDTFLVNNRKRKQPYSRFKDVNFFQTVREGSRSYVSRKVNTGPRVFASGTPYLGQSSESSCSGRTFIRPVRKTNVSLNSSSRGSGSSVKSILEQKSLFNRPAPLCISSNSVTLDRSFLSSLIDSPLVKRVKPSYIAQKNSEKTASLLSTAPSTPSFLPQNTQKNDENELLNSSLFIEATAEEQCKEFRKTYQENSLQEDKPQIKSLFIEETAEARCNEFRAEAKKLNKNQRSLTPRSSLIESSNSPKKFHSRFHSQINCRLSAYQLSPLKTHAPHKSPNFEHSPQRTPSPCGPSNIQSSPKTPSPCDALNFRPSPPNTTPPGLSNFQSSIPSSPFSRKPSDLQPSPHKTSSFQQSDMREIPNIFTGFGGGENKFIGQTSNMTLFSSDSSAGCPSIKKLPFLYSNRIETEGCSKIQEPPRQPSTPEMSPFICVHSANNYSKVSSAKIGTFGPPPFTPLPSQKEPPQSSTYNAQKCFFSESVKAAAGSSKEEDSFFKLPEMPRGSNSDTYDSLFITPGHVRALPRITTPQIFIPYNKTPSRPTPSHSKSSTKTPQTSPNNAYYVISVTEGRGHAVCEVGLAAIDLNHPKLILSQFSDSQTFKKTLAKINVIDPAEMIIPDTFKGTTPSVLYKSVSETFQDMKIVTVRRNHFSATQGLDTVRALLLPELSSLEIIIHKKYYSLAACEALMKYIEIRHGIIIAPKTLKVSYESAKDVVSIDMETCQRLELVMSNAKMVFPEKYSLFGLLNHTQTLGGKRRFRVNLLQPPSSLDLIKQRQNTVTALVNDQQSLIALQSQLLKFSNVERLLWLCLKTPNFKNEVKTFETFTNYILLLKASLEAVPHLCNVLNDIDDDYIINIRDELSDSKYSVLLARILAMIEDDARPARGYAESERQRCFAIKEGINDLLDVARATYSDLIQLVLDNITELGRTHSLPLKMVQSADLGYHPAYVLPKGTYYSHQQFPEIFSEVKLKNRTVHLLTEEIYAYNMRIQRAMQEIQLITNVVIYDLVESLREEVSYLYRLCEHISDLDVLACIAQISSTPDYVKPIFGEEFSLVGARHPILDHVRPTKPIPNNVFASTKKNFNIITGPNMGGKTVYVLMIALIQIMAQIGCYIPADRADVRLTNHIYVRKGNCDSIECGLSSFTKEMRELNYALQVITDTSLIILDELCAGTSSDQGTAYAWAYCEEFLKHSAFTFLTTHYHYLTNMSKVYKNVTNYNMEAVERGEINTEDSGLTFTYRLLKGITTTTNYGLRLMMSSALPKEIKINAMEIAEDLVKKRTQSLPLVIPDTPGTVIAHSKCEKIENFMYNIFGLSKTENFTKEIVEVLQRMAIEEILSDEEEDRDKENITVKGNKCSAHVINNLATSQSIEIKDNDPTAHFNKESDPIPSELTTPTYSMVNKKGNAEKLEVISDNLNHRPDVEQLSSFHKKSLIFGSHANAPPSFPANKFLSCEPSPGTNASEPIICTNSDTGRAKAEANLDDKHSPVIEHHDSLSTKSLPLQVFSRLGNPPPNFSTNNFVSCDLSLRSVASEPIVSTRPRSSSFILKSPSPLVSPKSCERGSPEPAVIPMQHGSDVENSSRTFRSVNIVTLSQNTSSHEKERLSGSSLLKTSYNMEPSNRAMLRSQIPYQCDFSTSYQASNHSSQSSSLADDSTGPSSSLKYNI